MPTPPPRVIVTSYLSFQALAVALWWALLLGVPRSIAWFHPPHWPDEALLGFWLADFVLLVLGSAVAAMAVWRRLPWASQAIWGLSAAAWYPALHCVGTSVLTGEAWIASALMVAMAGLTLSMATIQGCQGQEPRAIRATPLAPGQALAWTLVQITIFWSTFLWVLPRGLIELEGHLGIPGFSHHYQAHGALALWVAASALGLSSGVVMARRGKGTPLPTASAPNLVIAGPYRWVRNPMALAGITQGLAVGWYMGSFGVIVYSFIGGVVWHVIIRPVEEAELSERFGEDYGTYRRRVSLWLPLRR